MHADLSQPRTSASGAVGIEGHLRRWLRTHRLEALLVLILIAAYGFWRAPIPAANEPHYLSKSRHFWNADWCPRDLFLNSANVHWTFYATFGALTEGLSFEQTALVGRAIAWAAVALGWTLLVSGLTERRGASLLSAGIYLALAATGNLSGEWLIGGLESKVPAYAALFLSIAAACRREWLLSGVAYGISVSFHPVIGVWGAVAAGGAIARGWLRSDLPETSGGFLKSIAAPLVAGIVCALPGLIPAVSMLAQAATPAERRAADAIQVFDRLDHHLDPQKFPLSAWGLYGVLLLIWAVALVLKRERPFSQKFFDRFVAGTLLIAAAGAAIGFGPRWPGLMKFYPFRLADLFLPVAVAIASAAGIVRAADVVAKRFTLPVVRPVLSAIVLVGATAWWIVMPAVDRNPGRLKPANEAAWLDVCRWVAENTESDALFVTPRFNFGFKWYAQRSEVATWKDCPQDARSLVAWKGQLDEIRRWRDTWYERGFSDEALAELRERTGADFVVDWGSYPYRAEPIYRNQAFVVIRLPERGQSSR